jgi:hypothetical protein
MTSAINLGVALACPLLTAFAAAAQPPPLPIPLPPPRSYEFWGSTDRNHSIDAKCPDMDIKLRWSYVNGITQISQLFFNDRVLANAEYEKLTEAVDNIEGDYHVLVDCGSGGIARLIFIQAKLKGKQERRSVQIVTDGTEVKSVQLFGF